MWNNILAILIVILFLYVAWPKKQCNNNDTAQLNLDQTVDVSGSGQTIDGSSTTDGVPAQSTREVVPTEVPTESIETMRSMSSHVGRNDHSRWASARTDLGFH